MENYEKAYKEALKVMESLYNVVKYQLSSDALLTLQTLKKAFPELCESEDERIRKALIRNFTNQHSSNFPTVDGFTREQILAWLEKQGEQKSAWSEEDEEYYMIVKESILERWKGTDNKELIEIRNGALNWLKYLKPCWKLTDGQMKETLQTEYEKGRFDMREEMMKDAVKAEVFTDYNINFGYGSLTANIDLDEQHLKEGDKVKVIIVREE